MKMASTPRHLTLMVLILVAAPLTVTPVLPADQQAAEQIYQRAGVHGGFVVHLGCGDGRLTAALHAGDGYLVHGLDRDADNVAAARQYIQSLGKYGAVAVEQWADERLPFADNTVNLVVIEDPRLAAMNEVNRVLCPGGTAYVKDEVVRRKDEGDQDTGLIINRCAEGMVICNKPWPEEIDQWTHYLHGPDNNAVAKDERVGPPRHLQWEADPKRTRDHDALASISAMTSSNGRLFYIVDEGPTSMIHRPAQWQLVARDAFNGKTLWKRELESWVTQLRYFRSGPVQLPRRLVSVGDRVYVTLGLNAPVSVLDAATGETRQVFESTGHAEEFICMDDTLLVVIGDPQQWNRYTPKADNYWDFYAEGEPPVDKTILAIDRETGQLRWEVEGEHLRQLVPLSLVADGDRVFYLDNAALHCLDLATARELWAAPFATKGQFLRNYAPTVVVHKDTIVCQSLDRLAVMSIDNGETLWETKGYAGFASPGDVFVIDNTVWTFPHTATVHLDRKDVPGEGQYFLGFDLYTGQVKKTFDKNEVWPGGHHHRCYRNKATEQFVICGRRGVEFVDLEGENHVKNWWIRGVCQYGILPCNGLLYVPPHPCRCFSQYKFDGFHALASTNSLDHDLTPQSDRLRKGPAFGTLTRPDATIASASAGAEGAGRMWHTPVQNAKPEDWPTYRCDISRSGSTPSPVPAELGVTWKSQVGGILSSPVIADGKVLVSSVDRHTVHCLDVASGQTLWTFIAGGRVDSPPTIFEQMAVFGCRDGSAYAVALATGQLVWRFRAAPVDYRIVARNRLESVWPVHGSVLVAGGVVYFAAGHSSHVDGGIRLYGLDIWTGEILHESTIASEAASQAGALPDVLVSDGGTINMRHVQFDMSLQPQSRPRLNTLMTTTGMLEDLWAHRLNWALGSSAQPRSFDTSVPFGKLLVFDGGTAYGVQSFYTVLKHTKSMWPDTHTGHLHQKYARYTPDRFPIGNRLYAMDNGPPVQKPTKKQRRTKSDGPTANRPNRPKWSHNVPLQVRAMVLADDHLFIAGWEDAVGVSPAEFGAATGPQDERTWLWTIAAGDGGRLGQIPLGAEPVYDGMAAAAGRLFVSLQDGSLVCLGRR